MDLARKQFGKLSGQIRGRFRTQNGSHKFLFSAERGSTAIHAVRHAIYRSVLRENVNVVAEMEILQRLEWYSSPAISLIYLRTVCGSHWHERLGRIGASGPGQIRV